jgi:hypothetical protein
MEFLKGIPATVYTTVLGAAIALVTIYLTDRSNTRRLKLQFDLERESKEKEFIRDKLEELYLLHEAWLNALATSYLPILNVMKGEITYNQALDMFVENNKDRQVDFKRLQMLIDLYFPAIKPAFEKLSAARDRTNEIQRAHKREYKRGNTDGSAYVVPFIEAQKELVRESSVLKEEIIAYSNQQTSVVRR